MWLGTLPGTEGTKWTSKQKAEKKVSVCKELKSLAQTN